MAMLEKMRRYWNSYPHKRIDIESWSRVVDRLIRKISVLPEIRETFVDKYNNLLCLEKIYNISARNKRGQARAWLAQQVKHYVLENICKMLFQNFFMIDRWLERKIITNKKASYHGMAVVYKKKKTSHNVMGMVIRYDIGKIYLKSDIFKPNGYYDAVSTYVHELCHIFGGDASASFSQALTYAIEILMENNVSVMEGKKEWEKVFGETKGTGGKSCLIYFGREWKRLWVDRYRNWSRIN